MKKASQKVLKLMMIGNKKAIIMNMGIFDALKNEN